MLALSTAKILFFIAMNVGPHGAQTIYATSQSESYLWCSCSGSLVVEAKGFPASDFTRDPTVDAAFTAPSMGDVPSFVRGIEGHDWKRHPAVVLDNGDRIEKDGDHAFYIINAGGANEKVFTLLFPETKS